MEENEQPTIKRISLKWGVINGLVGIIFFALVDFAGLAGDQSMQWVGLLVFAGLLILAHREFKSEGDGFMSYGQGLGIGTLTAFISGIINNIFFFVYISFIDSSFIDLIKERNIMELENQGKSDAEIEQLMSLTEAFMAPWVLALLALVLSVFFAFLISLLITIFTKKEKLEFS